MAEPGLSELITTTLRLRSKVLKDNYTNNNAVFLKMDEMGSVEEVDGGRTIVEELIFDENSTFQRYSGDEELNIGASAVFTGAEVNWKQFAIAVVINGLEKRQNSGSNGIIKLLANRIKNAEGTGMNNLNGDVISDGTADGGKQIGGLKHIVAKTPTNTVAGIDRNTSGGAFYKNYTLNVTSVFGGALSTLTASQVRKVFTRALINTTRGNDKPNIGLLGNTYYEIVMDNAQSNQQIVDPKLARIGYEHLYFCGVPFVLGGGVNLGGQTLIGDTDGYMLNTKYLKVKTHKDANMTPLEERFSTNQDSEVRLITWMGNAICSFAKGQAAVFDS